MTFTNGKYLINRHDIDTSPRVAEKMFNIEKKIYGNEGNATYYFRDKTTNKEIIKKIESFGYEVGYHYENVTNFIKRNKIKNAEEIYSKFPTIRDDFLRKLHDFRKRTATQSLTVAAHGDFLNGRVGILNYELLSDEMTRKKGNIRCEAYDELIMKKVIGRYADHVLLDDFKEKVICSIDSKCDCIMLLTHPRNWKRDFISTTSENISRLFWEIMYRRF